MCNHRQSCQAGATMDITERPARAGRGRICSPDAFTLIELLVVIAIVALLLSILMPSLKNAKDMANKVMCANNMRAIGVGLMLYEQDNNGQRPPLHGGDDKPKTSLGPGLANGVRACPSI
jgi:prepilin-type N-terminal cleavage/methylation domain-containing protein